MAVSNDKLQRSQSQQADLKMKNIGMDKIQKLYRPAVAKSESFVCQVIVMLYHLLCTSCVLIHIALEDHSFVRQ